MPISLRVVNTAGQNTHLAVERILSIDGVPFESVQPIDPLNLHNRLCIIEAVLGESLSQSQPQAEHSSAESPLPTPLQPDLSKSLERSPDSQEWVPPDGL